MYGLKKVSRQMFPDLKLDVANVHALLSSGGRHTTGVDPGFYLYLEGRSLPSAVLMAVISYDTGRKTMYDHAKRRITTA